MNSKTATIKIWDRLDWRLLAFLLLFLDVKLVVKVVAIILIYILRPDFKFGFRIKASRLPIFYPAVIAIVIFNWLISGMMGNFKYDLVVGTGIFFWLLCILAMQQVKLSVEQNDPAIIHRTILAFFIINMLISFAVYIGIIIETGHINPYRYQGNFQKYFIGTGDYIRGVTLDTSTANAVLNAFGVIYFMVRKNFVMLILCMLVLLLTGSNVTNLALCFVLIYLFIMQTNKSQKSMIVVCLMMLMVFLVKVSPQNNKYIVTLYQRFSRDIPKEKPVYLKTSRITDFPDSILNEDEKKQKIAQLYLDSMNGLKTEKHNQLFTASKKDEPPIKFIEKPIIPKDSIHTAKFQHKKDTTAIEKNMLKFIAEKGSMVAIAASRKQNLHIPGKILAMKQTWQYFKQHPLQLFTGLGIGNFSSKLAFRVTAMKIGGGYPAQFSYINRNFLSNHLDLYLFYFTNADDLHSIANSPNSTYDQLLSEYGIAGLLCFAVFYIGFFVKRLPKNSYGLPLLLLMLAIFFSDYWYEQLSVVVFFELLLFLNIKESAIKTTDAN